MAKRVASLLLTFAVIVPSISGVIIEPFLSLPGNETIVAFLDLHRSFHGNGTCSDPDWMMFELAYTLEWKILSSQSAGIEIYDTCRSVHHTLAVLRQRILDDKCLGTQKTEISGVLSYVSSDVGNLINDTLRLKGITYFDIKNEAIEEAEPRITASLVHIVDHTSWTYVTTVADDSEISQTEHKRFLELAKEKNICIQYSVSENAPKIQMSAIKTPGIVVFTSDLSNFELLFEDLTTKHSLVIVTHDSSDGSFNLTNKILILSDGFSSLKNFSDFMLSVSSDSTNRSDSYRDYFVSRHNCSWNGTTNRLQCRDTSAIESYLLSRSSEMDIHTAVHVLGLIDATAQNTTTKDDDLVRKVSLSTITNGVVQKNMVFNVTGSSLLNPDIATIVNTTNFTFPRSQCAGWCPSCTACSGQMAYDGDFRHFHGDLLVTGMLPIRKTGSNLFECGDVAFNEFSDIYAAAFKFALESAQQRSPGLLPNVTIGGLIFDTCSDDDIATRTLLNFESCLYSFVTEGNSWQPNPQMVPGYVVPLYAGALDMRFFNGLGKLGITIHQNGALTMNDQSIFSPSRFNYSAIVHLLKEMDWTFVGIVTSQEFHKYTIDGFMENTLAKNICIAYRTEISATNESSINEAIKTVKRYPASAVIFFAKSNAVRDFFRALTYKPVNKVWILIETREDYLDFAHIAPPLGSIIFQKKGKQNTEFNEHFAADSSALNPWEAVFKKARDECSGPICKRELASAEVWMRSSDIIKSVDTVLHAVHRAYIKICPALEGLCHTFLEAGPRQTLEEIDNLDFVYQDETIKLSDPDSVLEGYSISNVQSNGLVQIGSWSAQGLDLNKEILKFYTVDGMIIERDIDSSCYSSCQCINNYTVKNATDRFEGTELDPEMGFIDSTAEFNSKLWCIIVIIISLSGCVVTLCVMMYIMCKVCAGALIRRYLVLGLLLLVAMLFLFLSVLPFVFTPSEVGCGMRFFAHGFSYAFCYAVILTKMTTLRDYKYIGLGGEISKLNQILSVFFITGVQVAIGVQWWAVGGSMLIQTTIRERTADGIDNVTYYACDSSRKDFIAYHSYVLLLLLICCFYSIGVRKETKNMKEARLLLVCSWFCLALWIAVIVTFFVLNRDYLEPIAAIGILANALSMTVIIYLPKLTVIARLKYEISEKSGRRNENGYKIDTDFQFERPYSLPGTMHSSYTDKTNTLPRSLAAFDSSLSY